MKVFTIIIVLVLAISLSGQEKKPLQEVLKENNVVNVAEMFSMIIKISKPMMITEDVITGDNELLKLERLESGIYEIYIIIDGPYYHFHQTLDLSILSVSVEKEKYRKHERSETGFDQCKRGASQFKIKNGIFIVSVNPISEPSLKNFEKEKLICTLAIYKKI